MDTRERFADDEEALRSAVAGILKHHWSALVSIVAQDSDGRTLMAQPAIKRRDIDAAGNVTFTDHPLLTDVPVHHPGGGGVTHTFPIKATDEVLSVIASRPLDTWHQQGGTTPPMATRTHSMSDAVAIPGLRSTPRKLEQISTTSAQVRDDAKHHVTDHDPRAGVTIKSADPSTPPASDSFDPFTMASKFIEHIAQAMRGVIGRAVDGGTEHSHGVDHGIGAWMSAMAAGGTNFVRAHPQLGSLLSALDGAHTVTASPEGVMLASTSTIGFQCPPSGFSMPSGAAAANVGNLAGDLAGDLPNPRVVSIAHLAGRDKLPRAASDSAAAALNPAVAVGSPYLNTAVSAGVALLAIRVV